ncbi:hypothetical protein ACU686_00710 [Yinghuangia aomiensis]
MYVSSSWFVIAVVITLLFRADVRAVVPAVGELEVRGRVRVRGAAAICRCWCTSWRTR